MSLSITSQGKSIGELQRDYLFKVAFIGQAGIPKTYLGSTGGYAIIDCFLTKEVFPTRKTAEIPVKWGGETMYISGPDESSKTGELVFRLDEGMVILNLWEDLKTLTGDLASHAAAQKANQTLTLEVYLVARDKETITDARRLNNVIVYSVEDINLDKEASGIQTFKVSISWDTSSRLDGFITKTLGEANTANSVAANKLAAVIAAEEAAKLLAGTSS
jgi:hypothetical protein